MPPSLARCAGDPGPDRVASTAGDRQQGRAGADGSWGDWPTRRRPNRDGLSQNPAAGLTPFLGYHVLEARALAGDHAGALSLIRQYWGAMIDLGATTFWEDFDLDWVAGSGRIDEVPPPDLRDIHAGPRSEHPARPVVEPLPRLVGGPDRLAQSPRPGGSSPSSPAAGRSRIRPNLGDLTRASGEVPTPLGSIRVDHRRQPDGSVVTNYQAPAGVEVVVGG